MGSVFQGFPGALDIRAAGAAQACNDGAANDCGDGLHGGEIAIGGDGESGFDHVDAEAVELVREAQLFLMVHAATGRLLSVAQGGVENGNANLVRGHEASFEASFRKTPLLCRSLSSPSMLRG